jgi:hypothetical protein
MMASYLEIAANFVTVCGGAFVVYRLARRIRITVVPDNSGRSRPPAE